MTRYIVCDCMLGKLARMLRILGYLVYYNPKADDNTLIRISREYDAILLTRDLGLSKAYEKAIYVSPTDINDQIKLVLSTIKDFGVEPIAKPLEICPECGIPLVTCEREHLKGNYYESTYCAYQTFYFCPSCEKVYWEGYQYDALKKTIESILKHK